MQATFFEGSPVSLRSELRPSRAAVSRSVDAAVLEDATTARTTAGSKARFAEFLSLRERTADGGTS